LDKERKMKEKKMEEMTEILKSAERMKQEEAARL
jgi:hypothetical protein